MYDFHKLNDVWEIAKISEFKAEYLVFDLRQLKSACESAAPIAGRQSKTKSQEFFRKLQDKISSFIRDGNNFITIPNSALHNKSPLHCLNTHDYEFLDNETASRFVDETHLPYNSTLEPIGGIYDREHLALQAQAYISRKQELASAITEPQVKQIIKNDIDAKNDFLKAVSDRGDSTEPEIPVSYKNGQSHDQSLLKRTVSPK